MFLRILTSDVYHNDRLDVSSSKAASATQLHQTTLIVWNLGAFFASHFKLSLRSTSPLLLTT